MYRYACKKLYGFNTALNYDSAKYFFKILVHYQYAAAMNALGNMYMQGLGLTQSNDSARYYYEQAAALHYAKACYNLGIIYKYGEGVTQDFVRSFDYFNQAVAYGNKPSNYPVGYYYYKGLGVEQDYTKALQYFKAGDDAGVSSCTYMLGYCYLKGYGVAQDTLLAKQYIAKSATSGYSKAINFIKDNEIDGALSQPVMRAANVSETDSLTPKTMLKIQRRKKDKTTKNQLDGFWDGNLIIYDWSGTKIDKKQHLKLYISTNGNTLSGSWIQDDTVNIPIQGYKDDSVWVFSNSKYDNKQAFSFEIKQGSFELVKSGSATYLKGNVSRAILNLDEPDRPVYIVLQKTNSSMKETTLLASDSLSNNGSAPTLVVLPNPFSKELTAKLTLANAQNGSFEVYDPSGRKIYSTEKDAFLQGVNSKQLLLDINPGTYTLRFIGEHTTLSTLIIKK